MEGVRYAEKSAGNDLWVNYFGHPPYNMHEIG